METYAPYLPDCAAELAYHQALVARDKLDYAGMETLVEKITGEDPVWKLRQAGLLMELGRFGEGTQLIAKAFGELRDSHRRDRYSIPILSRLVWAHWLLRAARRFDRMIEELPDFAKSKYQEWKCAPSTYIEEIKDKANKRQEEYLKNQNSIEPLFDQGCYQDNSNERFINNEIPEFLLLDGLSRSVGIPLYSGGVGIRVNLLAGTVEKLVLSGGIGVELYHYTLAIRSANSEISPSIKDIFTRIRLACASKEIVDILVNRTLSAINYWRNLLNKGAEEQQKHALSVLRVLMEVLARLVVRVSSEKAAEIFRLAVSLGRQQDFQDTWPFDVINHLLTYSLKSISESRQGELLADALAFPLQSELMIKDFPHWPNPIITKPPSKRKVDSNIDNRIKALIDSVSPESNKELRNQFEQRSAQPPLDTKALERLLHLHTSKYLKPEESNELANKIWGSQIKPQDLPKTGFFSHALLLFPTLDAEQTELLVRHHLYEHNEDVLKDTQKELRGYPSPEIERAVILYTDMANAAANETTRLFPTAEQASVLFDRLAVWRPHIAEDDFLSLSNNNQKRLTDSIGNALSYAIVPALSNEMKTVERLEQLKVFYIEVEAAFSIIPAFVYFVPISEDIAVIVEKIIRKSLQSRNPHEVRYATIALQKWMELPETASSIQRLNGLILRLMVLIESGRMVGLPQLLWAAEELFKKQLLSEEHIATLKEAVPNAFNAADYTNIEPNSQEAISASSIREACTKLAKILYDQFPDDHTLEEMLNQARTDALPEVRFAIEP